MSAEQSRTLWILDKFLEAKNARDHGRVFSLSHDMLHIWEYMFVAFPAGIFDYGNYGVRFGGMLRGMLRAVRRLRRLK